MESLLVDAERRRNVVAFVLELSEHTFVSFEVTGIAGTRGESVLLQVCTGGGKWSKPPGKWLGAVILMPCLSMMAAI